MKTKKAEMGESLEQFARSRRFLGQGYTHPRATMQKFEKKGVVGGASWKLLKTKVQICKGIAGRVGGWGLQEAAAGHSRLNLLA